MKKNLQSPKRSEILKRQKEKIMVAGIAIFSKSKIMKRLKRLSIGNSFHGKDKHMEKVSECNKERETEEGKDEENSSSMSINHEEGENEPEIEETNHKEDSSSSLELHDKSLSDANSRANDAAANLRSKLRSLSPSKRKQDPKKKGRKISQLMSGASFKSKCVLFKRIFKDLAIEEILIIDYSCALQRDILVHGRVYLSQNWMCFYANIFGWETLVTINWHEITAITKEKTARVIPNAIRISTSRERYFFTSFVSRDSSYTALFRVWQNALLGQPSTGVELRSLCRRFRKRGADDTDGFVNEKEVDETGDEAIENDPEVQSVSTSELSQDFACDQSSKTKIAVIPPTPPVGGTERALWLEENQDISEPEKEREKGEDDALSDTSTRSPSPIVRRAENLFSFAKRKKKKMKKKSSTKLHSLLPAPDASGVEDSDTGRLDESSSNGDEDDEEVIGEVFCPCIGTHPGTEYCVEEFDFDVDALFEHLFATDSDVMKQIHESRKMLNCQYSDMVNDEDGGSHRFLTYLLTLNYTIGPKHSDTTVKQIFNKDNTPGSFYVIDTEVANKGIPYADSFHVHTLYCLTRLTGNRCKMRIHSQVVYTKSMMGIAKNMIQRNADQAFLDYFKNLALVLREKSEALPTVIKKKRSRKSSRKSSREESSIGKLANGKSTPVKRPEPACDVKVETGNKPGFSHVPPPKSSEESNPGFVRGLAVLLLMLLVLNSYLFFRVYKLEKFATSETQCLPKNLPSSHENWYKLLQTQKKTHALEVKRLKDVIGGTIILIRQVETSIKELYDELNENIHSQAKTVASK